jgi:hypothetical protein
MSSVVGVCWIYTKYYFKQTLMSFSPWLFVLGTIFEETSSAPMKLEKTTFYRLSIGIWCLMVAILTNCYNGLMITGLNSPLPCIKIESFQDLLCDRSLFDAKQEFNITQWMETSKVSRYWNQIYGSTFLTNPYESKNCFRIWSQDIEGFDWTDFKRPFNDFFQELSRLYDLQMNAMMEISKGGIQPALLPYSEKIMWSLLHPGHAREPKSIEKIRQGEKRFPSQPEIESANQLEISNCDKKSAFIWDSEEIAIELNILSKNYPKKAFYTGKDLIRDEMESWEFSGIRNTKIPTYYKWVMHSGIYGRLETEVGLRRRKGHQIATSDGHGSVSSLSGGLVTLFILCGGGISLAVISFILECHYLLFNCIDFCRRMRCTGWHNRRRNRNKVTEFKLNTEFIK